MTFTCWKDLVYFSLLCKLNNFITRTTLYVCIYDHFMIVILYVTKPKKWKKTPEKPSISPRAAERSVEFHMWNIRFFLSIVCASNRAIREANAKKLWQWSLCMPSACSYSASLQSLNNAASLQWLQSRKTVLHSYTGEPWSFFCVSWSAPSK